MRNPLAWRPHECELRPVDVQHRPPSLLTVPAGATLVLYRCRCTRVQVVEVTGKWSFGQICGQREPAPVAEETRR